MVNCSSLVMAVVNVARDPLLLPPPRRGRVWVGVVHEHRGLGTPPSLTLPRKGGGNVLGATIKGVQ